MCNIPHHFSGKLTIPLLALLAIVLMVVLVAPPSYADPNFTWDRAAYWDVRYPTLFTHGRSLRDAFEFAEYKILDADQLKTWMDARIADGMPSVVVFCQDIAPDTVVESMSPRCTLRRYLDAGGKIVWYADIPMCYQGHSDGTRTDWGINGSINILGFNAGYGPPWDRDDEVAFTVDGVNWGLTETWQSQRPISPSGLRVLATDGRGNAAAWVKHYVPGDSYRGFVRLFDRAGWSPTEGGEPNINDLRRVAEYPHRPEPIVYYVDDDATGANDGSSWADAYQCLQDVLAAVRYGNEIRVAPGTYKPDQRVVITARGTRVRSSGDRTETFQLINGVAIKGGYAGFGEPDPDARDIEVYKTILSGDLNGNDSLNLVNNTENSYHVVTGNGTDETAVLDGFTITAGNANGTDWESQGGGMFNKSGSPTVTNCTFENNSATRSGGGMSNYNSSPTLTNCVFSRNSTNNNGGGILCHGASSPTITKCIISENTADFRGGGIECHDSSPTIINCTISGNAASVAPNSATGGGGIYCRDSSPTIINCTISGNTTGIGATTNGGIGCMRSSPTIINCTISNNASTNSAGGIGCYWYSSPTITNCIITGNTTGYWGGGINCYESSSPIITNCIIVGNAANRGGGIRCYSSSPIITNCTFSGNSAGSRGGGMFNDSSSPTLTNCILWINTPEEIYVSSGTPVVTYSDVQGGWPGEGNIDIDPMFVDAANGNYHLQASSPCIEAGDKSAVPEGVIEDLDGNPRIANGTVDMGAYEGRIVQPKTAYNPNPADGAEYVYPNVELSWSPGDGAQLHIVYFGDNFDDVNIDAGGILQETTTYTPGPLELDKVYYWRVDEFDGVVIHRGDIWSFTVTDPLS